jgi:hypothetical protein
VGGGIDWEAWGGCKEMKKDLGRTEERTDRQQLTW